MSNKKYLIKWDLGYGEELAIVEVESEGEASEEAYERWREAAETNAVYSAEELTEELRTMYGNVLNGLED